MEAEEVPCLTCTSQQKARRMGPGVGRTDVSEEAGRKFKWDLSKEWSIKVART